MNNLRGQRNQLLLDTDWTQNADVPQATKDNFATYRQALRDLPANSTPKLDKNIVIYYNVYII